MRGRSLGAAERSALTAGRPIEVAEIVNVAFAEDWSHVDLSARTDDGQLVALRISQATIKEALARLSERAALTLETSTAEPAAKLRVPIGEWRVAPDVAAATPTIECRTVDGYGVAVAFAYDPITAIPALEVVVDL